MPELPEVETIKRELEIKIIGKKIDNVIVNKPKIVKKPSQMEFINELKSKKIKKITRRGKYIIFSLFPKKILVIHLGMSGFLIYPYKADCTYIKNGTIKSKHNHIEFIFDDTTQMVFNDVRQFGKTYLVCDVTEIESIARLGVEPLSGKFTEDIFFKLLKKNQQKKIKSLIMKQELIAGLGNIYANESLFRSEIHPSRPASSLNMSEIINLHRQIKYVLNRAIELRGSTIADGAYRDTDGKKGEFKKEIQVYARKGKTCLKCNHPIEMIRIEGRSTFYCPKCQKL